MKIKTSKRQKPQFAIIFEGVQYEVGDIMFCPVEGEEGTLVDVTESEFSFYADGEGYSHPIPSDVEVVQLA
jgi:hypothetical protein